MKKILLFAAAILLLVTCKKDMNSDTSNQADGALKKYADMATNAAISYNNGNNKNDIDKKGDDKNGDDKNGNDKQVSKPIKISGSGTISYVPNGCGAGTLQLQSLGTGNSTVLGLFKQTTTICINGSTGEIVGLVTGVAKAANGDQLFYTFVGAGIDPATGFLFQNYIITGGSGRFKNASGSMTLLYNVNTPTNYSYTGSGTVTYSQDSDD